MEQNDKINKVHLTDSNEVAGKTEDNADKSLKGTLF